MKKGINALTVQSSGDARIVDSIKLRQVRPFVAKNQEYVTPKKSVFNRIIGDSGFELEFAAFLERCPDVKSFAKNYLAVNFRLDYVKADGDLSNFYPDFLVRLTDGRVVIAETKGLEDVDVKPKMLRLKQWCNDATASGNGTAYDFVYVDEKSFAKHALRSFEDVIKAFREFK